jgi:hypothetical protein
MSKEVLNIIAGAMKELGINYSFMEWKGKPVYPYFVGEYQEVEPYNEDGMQETAFILSGFSRETWLQLEEEKEKIKNHFNKVSGKTVIADNGAAVAVFYSNSLVVPTGDEELKKIQINLTIKEWSVS